jgi:hypothetical protein
VLFRFFREYSWAKNINNFLTFHLPRMPQNPLRHLLLRLAKPLAHRYNKAVGRRAYCVGWRNKEVGGCPYCKGEEDEAKNLHFCWKSQFFRVFEV